MQPNQYDFIMQSPTTPKKSLFGGGSQKNRILQIVILGGIILIVGLVALSFISKLGKGDTTNLYKLAAAQEDLIDITNNYSNNINTDSEIKKSASLKAIITSQNKETNTAITKLGIKKPTKQIALYKVTSYKKVLDDARTKGTYEAAYATLLANRVDDYRVKLQTTYGGANGTFKKSLASYYQQVNTIAPLPEAKITPTPTPITTTTPTPSPTANN